MAKTELDDYGDDLSFDFDDDYSMDGEDSPSDGKSRKPSSKIKTTLKESVENKYRDSKYRRELLKATLPSEYTSVLTDYDTVSKEAGGIWREQQREWEKHRKEVKKMFKPYSDVLGKVGLKRFSEWANEDERSRDDGPNEEQMDELRIQGILSETFGNLQEQQTQTMAKMETARQAKDDEKEASAKTDRDAQAQRTIEGNSLLLSLNNSIRGLADYNNKINFPYQKRSLEIQARQLVTQQRMLQTMNSFREIAVKELQDIHKNTALPDYLKITPSEMTEQAIAQRIMGGLAAPFDGVGSKLASKIGGKVRSKMKDFWAFLGETVTAANFQNEEFADGGMGGGDGTAWGGLKNLAGGVVGDIVINKPAELLRTKLAPKIRDQIEKHTGAKLFGSRLKSMGGQASGLLNEALKKGETGNGFFDFLINTFDLQDAAITGNKQIYDANKLDLEKAAFMDQRFKLSVTDVIPSWLKRIYSEIYSGNNNGKKAEDVTWDFKQGKFVSTKDVDDEVMRGLIDEDRVKKQVEAVNEWIDVLQDGKAVFSSATVKFLEKWVLKQLRSSNAINPMKLLSDDLSAPNDVKAELLAILPETMKLSEKQREMVATGLMTDILAASFKGNQGFNDRMSKAADAALAVGSSSSLDYKKIEELAKTTDGRRQLVQAGIANYNNGVFTLNDGYEDQLYDQFERVRKDSNTGKKQRYIQNNRLIFDGDQSEISDDFKNYEDTHDPWEVVKKSKQALDFKGKALNAHSEFFSSKEEKERAAILRQVNSYNDPDSSYNEGWGTSYFIDRKTGHIHTSAEKDFLKLRAKLRPDIDRALGIKKKYASGGRIESFAKGGNTRLKSGVTAGQPSDERTVKTHGGEFVVSHDATKFNVQLLEQINKLGAPLVNADGTINSVYHKLFGFKTAKEFDLKAKAKGLTNKTNQVKNDQMELMIKNLIAKLDMADVNETDAKYIIDAKINPEKRLAKVMKLWSNHQRKLIKNDPKNYAKNMGKRGIDLLNGKFDKWIDSDGTGVNVEIKNKLFGGIKSVGGKGLDAAKKAAMKARTLAKSELIDRDATLNNIKSAIDKDVGNKPFAKAQDIYMEGKESPILRRFAFGQRGYFDKKTGQVIKSPIDITGTVVNSKGDVILSNEDLLFGKFYTKDKGHQIPFKFIGAEEGIRQFKASKEYIKDKYNLITNSEKFKELKDKANAARYKYLMDKPIDIYLRGGTEPKLRASKFAEGEYIDQTTGNTLWTHHDITGPVITRDKTVVLTAEELQDGLFDVNQEHVKISKIKQYRNMAFRRSAEMYNKYAAKHVNKFTGKAMDWASKMGEKRVGLNYDKNPIDVYVEGEAEPRLKAIDFKQGKIFCKDKPIMSHSGITGAVTMIGEHGSYIVLDVEEFDKLVDAEGDKIKLVGIMNSKDRFLNYLKEAALPSKKFKSLRNFLTMSPEKRAEYATEKLMKAKVAYDVYVKGNPTKPILTKAGFEALSYISVKSGKPIIIPEQIDGPLVDSKGNQVLTEEQITKGIEDINGNKITVGGGVVAKAMASFKIAKRLKAALSKSNKEGEGDDKKDTMLKAIAGKLGLKGIGERIGSWKWQRAQQGDKKDDKPKEEAKEKKTSWIGTLIKKLMLPLGGLFGLISSGLGAVKSGIITAIGWLGTSLVSKLAGSGLGGMLGGLMSGGKGGKFGTIAKALAAGAAVYGGVKAYNYLDGKAEGGMGYEGDRNSATAGMDTTSAVLNQDANIKETHNGSMLDSITNNPLASAALTAAMFMPGTVFKGAKWLGGKAIRGAGNLMGGAGRVGGSMLGRLGGGIASRLPGALGGAARIAGGAASTLGGAAKLSSGLMGGIGRTALAVGGGAFSVLRLLTGPVGIGLTVAWYGGKALMKLWNNHKNPWNRFRLAQYGFNHNNKDVMEKIAKIETAAASLVKIDGKGVATLASDDKAINEILKICGFKDEQGNDIPEQQERLPKFATWFKSRFVKVYASYLRTLKRLKGKAEMIDLQTLNRSEQEILLKEVHFTGLTDSPYVVNFSPFEDPSETERDAKDVDVIARKLRNKIGQLPVVKDYKEPSYAQDGLDDKTAKKADKDASVTEKTKAEMDKDLDKEKLPANEDPKTAIDKANQAVTYQAKASDVITKTHTKAIITATEATTKETDGFFSRALDGLKAKVANYFSAISTGFSKIANGEIIDGAGDLLGASTGSVGNAIYSGGQWLKDMVTGGDKNTEANLINLAKKAGVTSPVELAMFMAQTSHESGGFKHSREMGNDADFAKYNNRRDLGNGPNDGAKYKGRGWIQLTGKANYAAFSKWAGVDVVSKPELLEKEPYASMAAVWYWTQHPNMKRGRVAAANGDINGATKAINGGLNGLADRKKRFAAYMQTVGKDGGAAIVAKAGGGTEAPANPAVQAANNAKAATGGGKDSSGKALPVGIAMPGSGNNMVANAQATLDAKYGGKATPANPATTAKQPTPAKDTKVKYFVGDSIADGFKTNHGGNGWTKVGADPKTVNMYLHNTVYKTPTEYRKERQLYLSTGLSNNPTDYHTIALMLGKLKELGVSAYVFGVSNKYPKGDPAKMNSMLANMCKSMGHKFLGGFNPGKDNIHPASYKSLPGVTSAAPPQAKPQTAQQAKTAASAKVAAAAKTTNTAQPTTATAQATKPQQSAGAAAIQANGDNDWDFSKIAKAAMANKKPETIGRCGEYTRKALQAGDLKGKISKICGGTLGASAYMFVGTLPKVGFNKVFQGTKLNGFQPQIGDVAIFGKGIYGDPKKTGSGWYHGHACVYTGAKWVSDFVQSSVYPSSKYQSTGLMMSIFRASGIAPQGGFDCPTGLDEDAAGASSAGGISDNINSISDGSASTGGSFGNGGSAYSQHAGRASGASGGDYTTVLNNQLDVQREILSVLKTIAGGGKLNNSETPNNQNTNDPNGIQSTINGVPVDAAGNPINQNNGGMSKPDLSVVNQKPQGNNSIFNGVTHPISVAKPV